MSQTGEIKLYTSVCYPHLEHLLSKVLQWSGVSHQISVSRYVDREDEDGFIDFDLEVLGKTTPGEACEFYEDGSTLLLDCGVTAHSQRIYDAIERDIPVTIRGDYCPGVLFVYCGLHRIVDDTLVPPAFIARATLTVSFFGYSTALDSTRMSAAVFALPEMTVIRQELEELLGPLQGFVHWSV